MYMRSFPKTSYQFWSHFGLNALFCQSDLLLPGFSQTGLFNIQTRCKFILFGNQLHHRRRRSPQGLFVVCKFLRCRPKLSNTSVLLGYFLYSSFRKILDCYSNRIWLQAGLLGVHRNPIAEAIVLKLRIYHNSNGFFWRIPIPEHEQASSQII